MTAALVLLLWGAAFPAMAGGPTSVLLASPESMKTASLYYSDDRYLDLSRLLGSPGTGTRDKPPEADLVAARRINVTWMAHDVSPWRFDQVYPADDGRAVWIHTAVDSDDPSKGTWHRAERPAELRALLKALGLMGRPAPGDGGATAPRATEAAGAGDTEGAAAGAPPTRPSASEDGSGWWWALPGAAAGAVLALVLRPRVARLPWDRLRGEPGPRQELRDA